MATGGKINIVGKQRKPNQVSKPTDPDKYKVWKILLPILIAIAWESIIIIVGNWMLNHWFPLIGQAVFVVCSSFLAGVYAWKYREEYYRLLNKLFPRLRINYIPITIITVIIVFALSIPIAIGLTNIKSGTAVATIKNTESNIPKPSESPSTSNIPPFVDMSKIHSSENVTLTIGIWPYHFNWSNFKNSAGAIYLADNVTFNLYTDNGRIYVDTSVYGGPNFAPIHIHGTSFVVTPPTWDQNYNENEFEVVNQDGDPVFQLIYKSQFDIVIYGIFPSSNGILFWATPSGNTINPSPFSDFHLTPIFRYPSSKYPGQLNSGEWGVTPQTWLNGNK
ncbi:MAG: hypothetical protein ABSG90_02715 [Dehalococcoidia bacterium]|jgi:hypothetical protein